MRNLFGRMAIFLLLMAAFNYFMGGHDWSLWGLFLAVALLAALGKEAVGALLTKGLGRPVNESVLFLLFWLMVGLLGAVVTWLGAESGLLSAQWEPFRFQILAMAGVGVCLEFLGLIGTAVRKRD